jgi:hypothetical protein
VVERVEEPAVDIAVGRLADLDVGGVVAGRVVRREAERDADPAGRDGSPERLGRTSVSEEQVVEESDLGQDVGFVAGACSPWR